MTITIEATYEDGVLKPAAPLPLKESERVDLIVRRQLTPQLPSANSPEIAASSYGIVRWTGDHKTLQRLAEDPEFGIWESP